ncbi:MAG: Trm112 family protein [Gemmatimonadetes bacterium]|nr:hypothetical protein [Gemmatimonadota bacterium]NNM04673.1 Trm112 family protein [Gemmatimonadota bacterium]
MHLALTDRLVCPECGPGWGLILLATEVRERRVLEGELGCPNCRQNYPVSGGVADLRSSPRDPLQDSKGPPEPPSLKPEDTLRLGALLGVTEGPGTVLLLGPAAVHAEGLAALVEGIEVVGSFGPLSPTGEREGVSRIVARSKLPFAPDTFLGVLVSGDVSEEGASEAARVLSPGRRLVLLDGTSEALQGVSGLEMEVLLKDGDTLVAKKVGPGSLPLVTLRGP